MKDTVYTSAWRQDVWLQAAPLSISRSGRCEYGGVPAYRVVFAEDGGHIENKISGKKFANVKDRDVRHRGGVQDFKDECGGQRVGLPGSGR